MSNAFKRVVIGTSVTAGLGLLVLATESITAARTIVAAPGLTRDVSGTAHFPGDGNRTVTWLGDSTIAGTGATDKTDTVAWQVARLMGGTSKLEVLAKSGDQVHDVLANQVARVNPSSDLIFIEVGANDATHLTSAGDFTHDYRLVLSALPKDVPVVVVGVPDMGSIPHLLQPLRAVVGWRGRRLESAVRTIAADRGLTYVNLAAGTGPSFRHSPHHYYSVDGYHPGDNGYALWAKVIYGAMK